MGAGVAQMIIPKIRIAGHLTEATDAVMPTCSLLKEPRRIIVMHDAEVVALGDVKLKIEN